MKATMTVLMTVLACSPGAADTATRPTDSLTLEAEAAADQSSFSPFVYAYTTPVPRPIPAQSELSVYVMSYFLGKDESVYLLYSTDAIHWTKFNGGKPVLQSKVGGKNIRDPFIGRGQDGWFHLVGTNPAKTSSRNSDNIFYARSHDLVNWQDQRILWVKGDDPGIFRDKTWAPEFIWDPASKQYFLHWCQRVTNDDVWMHEVGVFTKDFATFSEPVIFFDKPSMDGSIMYHDGLYYLTYKGAYAPEHPANFATYVASSPNPHGPYTNITAPIEGTDRSVYPKAEGSFTIKLHNENRWLTHFDYFASGEWGISETTDLKNWTLVKEHSVPDEARHGSIVSITQAELDHILHGTPVP